METKQYFDTTLDELILTMPDELNGTWSFQIGNKANGDAGEGTYHFYATNESDNEDDWSPIAGAEISDPSTPLTQITGPGIVYGPFITKRVKCVLEGSGEAEVKSRIAYG